MLRYISSQQKLLTKCMGRREALGSFWAIFLMLWSALVVSSLIKESLRREWTPHLQEPPPQKKWTKQTVLTVELDCAQTWNRPVILRPVIRIFRVFAVHISRIFRVFCVFGPWTSSDPFFCWGRETIRIVCFLKESGSRQENRFMAQDLFSARFCQRGGPNCRMRKIRPTGLILTGFRCKRWTLPVKYQGQSKVQPGKTKFKQTFARTIRNLSQGRKKQHKHKLLWCGFPADIPDPYTRMPQGQKVSPHHRGCRKTHFLVRTSTIFGADVHDPKGCRKTLYKKFALRTSTTLRDFQSSVRKNLGSIFVPRRQGRKKTMTATDVTGFDAIFSTGFFATFSTF